MKKVMGNCLSVHISISIDENDLGDFIHGKVTFRNKKFANL